MSAFMVSNETLSEIADFIEAYCLVGYNGFGFDMPNWIVSKYYDVPAREIFEELAEMNIAALKARYKDYEDMVGDVEFDNTAILWKRRENNVQKWHYQLLKSLQCYLYQCSEGDVPERELYKELTEFKYCLMGYIIRKQPEYDEAKWR